MALFSVALSKNVVLMSLIEATELATENVQGRQHEPSMQESPMIVAPSIIDLEDEEEALLGEFAEEFLEKHKFKIVVPESFLLREKDMIEYLEKKFKIPRYGQLKK